MVTPFQSKVYALCSRIPKGRVTTYKILAEKLKTKAYRAVGQALNKNPFAPRVPCHRVVAHNGTLGGFAHGSKEKERLLTQEGVRVKTHSIVDFHKTMYTFNEGKKS